MDIKSVGMISPHKQHLATNNLKKQFTIKNQKYKRTATISQGRAAPGLGTQMSFKSNISKDYSISRSRGQAKQLGGSNLEELIEAQINRFDGHYS